MHKKRYYSGVVFEDNINFAIQYESKERAEKEIKYLTGVFPAYSIHIEEYGNGYILYVNPVI